MCPIADDADTTVIGGAAVAVAAGVYRFNLPIAITDTDKATLEGAADSIVTLTDRVSLPGIADDYFVTLSKAVTPPVNA